MISFFIFEKVEHGFLGILECEEEPLFMDEILCFGENYFVYEVIYTTDGHGSVYVV